MKFNELKIKKRRNIIRPGRGISAGRGKTAGRGTKGQNARTGGGTRPGFEGGQNPLAQRMPKLPGFTSHRTPAQEVYTGALNGLSGKVDNHTLAEAGLVENAYHSVKLIVKGEELTAKLDISTQFASKGAVELIQQAGGTYTKLPRPQRVALVGTEKDAKRQNKD